MKQLGNLAIVCAQRKDTILQIHDGKVEIRFDHDYDWENLKANWDDDEKIMEFIMALNHGRFIEKSANKKMGGN